jgi:hypothetical protein
LHEEAASDNLAQKIIVWKPEQKQIKYAQPYPHFLGSKSSGKKIKIVGV